MHFRIYIWFNGVNASLRIQVTITGGRLAPTVWADVTHDKSATKRILGALRTAILNIRGFHAFTRGILTLDLCLSQQEVFLLSLQSRQEYD